MPLRKRLVVFGTVPREGLDLDALLQARGFQVYSVDAEDRLFDALEYSHPDAAVLCAPCDVASLLRAVAIAAHVGGNPLFVVRPGLQASDVARVLEAGADYVATSVQPDILAAQIHATLRRSGRQRSATSTIELGYLHVDLQRREVRVHDRLVPLTRTEFDVLRVLAERPGTVLPSGEIMQHVMGVKIPDAEAQDLLKVHIHRLRQKLEADTDRPRFIKTVRGQGYLYAFERRARDRTGVPAIARAG